MSASNKLAQLEAQDQLRALRDVTPASKTITVGGIPLLNLSGNDYLGLSQHPALIDAAVMATRMHGVGSGASRLVSGTSPVHSAVEDRFASLKHAQAALLFPTGYSANLAALTTLAGPGDLIVLDKLVHASLIDAAMASGADVRTYPHLQLQRAKQLLGKQTTGRRLLVTDSVFSMDGDCADLPACCDLADQTGALLVVDEAHGTGVLGETGAGLAEAQGVAERMYTCGAGGVVISTASKALGGLGGLITADRSVIDLLINKARPFIYSTAVPPAQAAAIMAALEVIHDEPGRRQHLMRMSTLLRKKLAGQGWPLKLDQAAFATPIIPLIVGTPQAALSLADTLREQGVFAPAIRPPTVSPGTSRVRLSLRADLSEHDIEQLAGAIGRRNK